MVHEGIAQSDGKAHRSLCCKILGNHRAEEAHRPQKHQKAAHFENIPPVGVGDAHIHNARYHQRDTQLKGGLQELEQRP